MKAWEGFFPYGVKQVCIKCCGVIDFSGIQDQGLVPGGIILKIGFEPKCLNCWVLF